MFGGRRLLGASEGGAAQEETLRDALAAEMRRALLERGSTDPYLPDAAFTLLRRLDAGVALGERVLGPAPPPRQRGQPDPLARPAEPVAGCVLASHPLLCRDAVLLLHADSTDGYAMGLVLNNPSVARVGGALYGPNHGKPGSWPAPAGSKVFTTGNRTLDGPLAEARPSRDDHLAPFAHHQVWVGGPDGGASMTMLHPYGAVRGAVRVGRAPAGSGVGGDGCGGDLFYGGDLQHAAELVNGGDADASQFVFFKGRVDWRPGELSAEIGERRRDRLVPRAELPGP